MNNDEPSCMRDDKKRPEKMCDYCGEAKAVERVAPRSEEGKLISDLCWSCSEEIVGAHGSTE